MDSTLKTSIKKFLPNIILTYIINIRNRYFKRYYTNSYSQEGEDILLSKIFGHKKSGFYVNIGAHHPKRFSNDIHVL
jgi:hypothetical protein